MGSSSEPEQDQVQIFKQTLPFSSMDIDVFKLRALESARL